MELWEKFKRIAHGITIYSPDLWGGNFVTSRDQFRKINKLGGLYEFARKRRIDDG